MKKIILLLFCLSGFIAARGQCSFKMAVSVLENASCEKNGIIKAEIKDMTGNLDIDNAQYRLDPVNEGGFNLPFNKNEGIISGVPAGTYKVTVRIYCGVSQMTVTSDDEVTVISTHPNFDINKVYVETAGMISSHACSPTGTIPIQIGSGLMPYTVKIVAAPDESLNGKTYSSLEEGPVLLTEMPWGAYEFEVSDACSYTLELGPIELGIVEPEYSVKVKGSPACLNTGGIYLSLKNGTPPYTVTFTETPEAYTGKNIITVDGDCVDYPISDLPQGAYKFSVEDKCRYYEHTAEIREADFSVKIPGSISSAPCSKSGEVTFRIEGGLAPYTIETCLDGDCHMETITVSETKDTVIKGLAPGNYTFKITDKCTESVSETLTVGVLDISVQALSIPASSCSAKDGAATVTVENTFPPFLKPPVFVNEQTGEEKLLAGESPYSITGLEAGNYVFKFTDGCERYVEEKIVVKAGKKPVEAIIDAVGACGGNQPAALIIYVTEGISPWTVTVGCEDCDPEMNLPEKKQSDPLFVFGGLLYDKTYVIKVTDACGEHNTFTVHIDMPTTGTGETVTEVDLYEDVFFMPENQEDISNCRNLLIKKKLSDPKTGRHWALFSEHPELFEVAFVRSDRRDEIFDGASDMPWEEIKDTHTAEFEEGYCEARLKGLYYVAYVRYKENLIIGCEIMADNIVFAETGAEMETESNCNYFDLKLALGDTSIICLPYTVVLTGKDDGEQTTYGPYTGLKEQTVTKIPHGKYAIALIDGNQSCKWDLGEIKALPPLPESPLEISYPEDKMTCDKYAMTFIIDYCSPYSWILTETDDDSKIMGEGTVNAPEENISDKMTVEGLEYDVNYTLCLTFYEKYGDDRKSLCEDVFRNKITENYSGDFVPVFCLPDTAK
ncbi:MAG: hypothetical protein LBH60_08410, partial [Prevotellaceae bacterium]|nr:hypothetical protein [Prevotellaceae bacterium]